MKPSKFTQVPRLVCALVCLIATALTLINWKRLPIASHFSFELGMLCNTVAAAVQLFLFANGEKKRRKV